MLSLARRLQRLQPFAQYETEQLHLARSGALAACFSTSSNSTSARRKNKFQTAKMKKLDDKTEWWVVDGEMHEIGENVPLRERFVIPRDNLPNKRRKQMREQFMRRTRLVLKESEHEPWCKRYMELYQELRENWERLYWDEGYSKKLAQDHANYESAEDDDLDFSPYRRKRSQAEQNKDLKTGMKIGGGHEARGLYYLDGGGPPVAFQLSLTPLQWHNRLGHLSLKVLKLLVPEVIFHRWIDLSFGRNRYGDTWEKVGQIRDKFEYDREKRMREKAFAPMNSGIGFNFRDSSSRNQPFDAHKYFSESERDRGEVSQHTDY
ncbi:PREDICTED: uncharacterized protein LOC104587987 isoform X1 [Nelumbo nucifera]|uniref:Uncharacterized protein n=2 Tax=Nelumbo nucifera TaxID=4432 RepID=A0A822XWV2_NELNU|nr:PREDICTED: uncharacterized protein LOC104587987 isoform X1 [Nelumbo nucifera]DAD24223.1 TPA_asm: hypothetical protein HUJ06_025686 [Nelumbo nucifera]